MFTKNNIALKYKKYIKSLQNLKDKLPSTNIKDNSYKEIKYYKERLNLNNLKENVLNSSFIKKSNTVHAKFKNQNEDSNTDKINNFELFNEIQYYDEKLNLKKIKENVLNSSFIKKSNTVHAKFKNQNEDSNNDKRNNFELFNETQYYDEKLNLKKIKENVLNSSFIKKSTGFHSKFKNEGNLFNFDVGLKSFSEHFKPQNIKFKFNFNLGAAVVASSKVVEPIPEPPSIPVDNINESVEQINELGEATFASLGLGGYTPVGLVQNAFEYIHVVLGVPWWEAILIGTIIIRIALFPLVIVAQRNAAKMNNYLPQLQMIQLKMTDARQRGNQLEVARYSQELMIFMKEKQLNPLKNMIVPLAQMPIFISFFMALREMSNVPVDSLRTGGLWWFTDLTVPDQYFLMPLLTSVTLLATIELGTDTAKLSSQNLQTMKYVLRALPVIIFPFTMNFPGAILCYWVSTNFISLMQVGILKIPAVRDYFNIEPLVHHKTDNLPMKPKGFTEGIKESWTNMKITNELEHRRKLDELQFQRAGRGPVVKTYKFDPTKIITEKKQE